MSQISNNVMNFHHRFGHPAPIKPTPPSKGKPVHVEMRKAMIKEEANELIEAIEKDDLLKIAREAIDLAYIAIGTLVQFGIPFQEAWDIVHASNMDKQKPPNAGDKPLKPEGWRSPDAALEALLVDSLLGRES